MNGMRKVICFLMAMMLAAFAMPVMAAPQKTYSLLLLQTSVVPLKATIYVKNESPPPNSANSNIGSFTATLAGVTIDTSQPVVCPGALCSATATTVTVTNISPPIQQQGIFGVEFSVSTCGEASVASATVATGSNLSGGTFAPKSDSNFFNGNPPGVSSSSTATFICGSLACNTNFTVPNLACTSPSTDLTCVSGYRGNNKDGLCSGTVDYAVTNDLAFADKTLHVEWATAETAAFAYRVNATTNVNPQVSWGGGPFIDATNCLGFPSTAATDVLPPTDLLPAQLTTLAASVAVNDKKITVATLPAKTPPYDIVIGPEATGVERMTVTKTNAATNQLTVTRGVGGTDVVAHTINTSTPVLPVMSTPLSAVGGYAGGQVQMCIAQGPISTVSGYYFWFIDIGDGSVKFP